MPPTNTQSIFTPTPGGNGTGQWTNPAYAAPNPSKYGGTLINTPQAGSPNFPVTQQPTSSAIIPPPPTTINANAIGAGVNPLAVSSAQPQTVSSAISGATDNTLSELDKYLASNVNNATANKNESSGTLRDLFNKYLGVQSSQSQEEANANIPALAKNSNDTFSALQASKRAQQKELEAVANTGGTTGVNNVARINEINRRYASEQADLSISYDVANRNYTSAQAMVDKKIQLQLEPLKTAIDFQTTFFNDNKDTLSKAEQNQLQNMIAENKQKLEDKAAIGDVLKTAINNGVQLSPQILNSLNSASTASEAYSILAKNGISLQDPLDRQKKMLEIAKLKNSSGGSGKVSNITQSIIDNPSLFDDLTPTVRGTVIGELQANGYDTSNLGMKSLSDTAIAQIAQTQKALSDLDDLKGKIKGNEEYIGPIAGIQRFNPYSKARQIQADVDRVKQTVGKALEGGVLRKEDEEKYKKILATLADTPSTAVYKVDALTTSIQRDIENYKQLQQAGGRSLNVKGALNKKGATNAPTDLRSKYGY